MRRFLLLPALATLALTAAGAVPFAKGTDAPRLTNRAAAGSPALTPMSLRTPSGTRPNLRRAPEQQVLIDEDFSRFSEGSETEPGPLVDFVDVYHIPDDMTDIPGWTGQGVHPAGGCVALYPWPTDYGYDRGGYISTPPMMMAGTATITLRARRLGDEPANLWVSLCDDYYGPGDDDDFTLTDEWQEFSLQASGSLEDPSYFQIMADEGKALVDDVRVEFRRDRIMSPEANPAVNISPDSFLASWEDTGAPMYRLTVLCTEKPLDAPAGTLFENFDGINVTPDGKIDPDNPGIPDGWTIGVSSISRAEGWLSSAPNALVFENVGDVAESPATPEPLDRVGFWIRPDGTSDDDYSMSLLRVEIYHSHTDRWETLAQLPWYYLDPAGGEYVLGEAVLGNDATRVRFSMLQKGKVSFIIDDVAMHYASRGTTYPLVDALELTGCEYLVEGIDPRNEHTYYVCAVDGDLVSQPSYEIWVDGVAGLPVKATAPTEITSEAFTANWDRLGHAETYSATLSQVVEASADMEDVTVLSENFDRITEGTPENPGMYWISPFDFCSAGWADTGWCATNPAWAFGMAGSMGTSWIGTAGLVYSPRLDLSCDGGTGFDVEATVYTTVDSFVGYDGMETPEGVFVMVLDTYQDSQAKAFGLIQPEGAGLTTARVHVPVPEDVDLHDVIVAFMSMSGQTFFVDDVRISQNIRAGETLNAPMLTASTDALSYRFTGLDEDAVYSYSVTASVEHDFVPYISQPSEAVSVRTAASGIVTVPVRDTVTDVYSMSGIRLGSSTEGLAPGIYLVRRGDRTERLVVR